MHALSDTHALVRCVVLRPSTALLLPVCMHAAIATHTNARARAHAPTHPRTHAPTYPPTHTRIHTHIYINILHIRDVGSDEKNVNTG